MKPTLHRQQANGIVVLALLIGLGWRMLVPAAASAAAGLGPLAPASAAWAALPNGGLDGQVYTLAVKGNDLYVGGHFNATADGVVQNLNNIAVLSGGVWSALPHNGLTKSGPPPEVSSIAVVGDDVYVGGTFTQTGDGAVPDLNNIAVLSNGAWHALPHGGLNERVLSLAFNGSDLYVGGFFSATADGAVKNLGLIAKYNIAGWTALPNGGIFRATPFGGLVGSIIFHNGDVLIGGYFTQTGDSSVSNLNNIARLSGGTWQSLPNAGLGRENEYVDALAYVGDDLYAGGRFHGTADGSVADLNNIARLSAGHWLALPHQGLGADFHSPPEVNVLAVQGSDLYVGGFFDTTYDRALTDLSLIAKFSGGQWSALPNGGLGGIFVNAIAFSDDRLFAGGAFGGTADISKRSINQVAVLYFDNFPLYFPAATR